MQDTGLVGRFEGQRPRLRAMAYRMLGSLPDTDDALQETWIRLQQTDDTQIDNLDGWLTTVLSRICLNMLRGRRQRAEDPLGAHVPDPLVTALEHRDPESEAVVDERVGMALMVVFDQLVPAERVAFVLHDVFGVPFDMIADALSRTPAAARQLASRARRRVHQSAPVPDSGLRAQREIVDAFFAAGRAGDLTRLIGVLDPDVVLRADFGGFSRFSGVTAGAEAVATRARYAAAGQTVAPLLVNGSVGALIRNDGRPSAIMGFTIVGRRIVRIDVLGDPRRLALIQLPAAEP